MDLSVVSLILSVLGVAISIANVISTRRELKKLTEFVKDMQEEEEEYE